MPSGVCADSLATGRAPADGAARAIAARRRGAHCTACGSARKGSGAPIGRPPRAGAGMSGTAPREPPDFPCAPQPARAATAIAAPTGAISR